MENIKKGIIIECEECNDVITITDDTENKDILIYVIYLIYVLFFTLCVYVRVQEDFFWYTRLYR